MTKKLSEAERLERLMTLAQEAHKFGSVGRRLQPGVIERPRDCGDAPKMVKTKSELPTEQEDRLMNTVYGLPPSRF